MRMRTAMPASLNKRQMLVLVRVVNPLRGITLDGLRQQSRVIGDLHSLHFLSAYVKGWFISFDQFPLKRSFLAIDIEAFRVLTSCIEEKSGHFKSEILIANLEVRGLK